MNTGTLKTRNSIFESIKHTDEAGEFWYGRELMDALEYKGWQSFREVIRRAELSVKNTGMDVENHFRDIPKMVTIGYDNATSRSIADIRLTRYACYIIAQNGNPVKKPRIAEAQRYFAIQARRQELSDQYQSDIARLSRRHEYSESDKHLSSNIMEAGVGSRGLASVKNEGDKALFGGKSSKDMKEIFETGDKPWANRAHNVVLAGKTLANEMTAANIENRGLFTYPDILDSNNQNNKAVRKTIEEQQGMSPEDFPPAEDTDKIKKRLQSEKQNLIS